MLPSLDQIWASLFQVSFPGNPGQENPDGQVPFHMKGREGIHHAGTQIRNLRMSSPLDGAPDVPAAGHPLCCFIPCSVCSGLL
jgi:hypothetical protein